MKYLKYNLEEVLHKIKAYRYIFFFLDYDGTLVEFKDDPEQALPSEKVKNLISELSLKDNIITTIVSGRTINNLLRFFKDIDSQKINWVGIHGAQFKYKNSDITLSDDVKKSIPFIEDLRKQVFGIIKNIPCFNIEDKKVSFAIHYRKCRGDNLLYLDTIIDLIKNFTKNKPIDYLRMKKVIEIKSKNINKGNSLKKIKKRYSKLNPSINICIGDDVTDNYLFKSNKEGININVGTGYLKEIDTEYFLKNVGDVHYFLQWIINYYQIHYCSNGVSL